MKSTSKCPPARSGAAAPEEQPGCLIRTAPNASAAPLSETSRALRRMDGCALSNRAVAPCRGLPARLADGLGLESTPVRNAEPAPLERRFPAAPLVPPLPHRTARN